MKPVGENQGRPRYVERIAAEWVGPPSPLYLVIARCGRAVLRAIRPSRGEWWMQRRGTRGTIKRTATEPAAAAAAASGEWLARYPRAAN